ncbi:hypothetical protein TEA_019736 [Camellia sinensis var. sinensis]|uniref:Nucleoplasmin-like domain-containing protein n=1 Tax=Camellia sinensis var. sinensis TaxID=542762 RepID=A0A4S4E1R5_CAMSN|nr:hypothetical protein TEA_019736 [Camellia sinensis var. sinensis]
MRVAVAVVEKKCKAIMATSIADGRIALRFRSLLCGNSFGVHVCTYIRFVHIVFVTLCVFEGLKVKSGQSRPVRPGKGKIVHLSQACLGEVKKNKGSESIYLYATVDGKKLVLGTLSPEKFPQQQFDVVFDRKFVLSHNWKSGYVCLSGYRCDNPSNKYPFLFLKSKSHAKQDKPPAAKNVEEGSSSTDDSTSDFFTDSDESYNTESESAEVETEDDDEEEEAPKKVVLSKKRPAESATKTPGPDKKAKLVTPQKSDAKKGSVHVATTHPEKQAGKTPGNQSKQPTPKSAGSNPCKSCNK